MNIFKIGKLPTREDMMSRMQKLPHQFNNTPSKWVLSGTMSDEERNRLHQTMEKLKQKMHDEQIAFMQGIRNFSSTLEL